MLCLLSYSDMLFFFAWDNPPAFQCKVINVRFLKLALFAFRFWRLSEFAMRRAVFSFVHFFASFGVWLSVFGKLISQRCWSFPRGHIQLKVCYGHYQLCPPYFFLLIVFFLLSSSLLIILESFYCSSFGFQAQQNFFCKISFVVASFGCFSLSLCLNVLSIRASAYNLSGVICLYTDFCF